MKLEVPPGLPNLCDLSVDSVSIFQLNRTDKNTMPSEIPVVLLYIHVLKMV